MPGLDAEFRVREIARQPASGTLDVAEERVPAAGIEDAVGGAALVVERNGAEEPVRLSPPRVEPEGNELAADRSRSARAQGSMT